MHDLAWGSNSLGHFVRETLLELLYSGDPPNLSILRYALTILLAEKEPPISELAVIAEWRVREYSPEDPKFILWMSVWLQLEAEPALVMLKDVLQRVLDSDQIVLRIFIPSVYSHIRPSDDVEHTGTGVYTPTDRDNIQDFRNGLLNRLAVNEDPEATTVLRELITVPVMINHRDWMLHLLDERTERDVDLPRWSPEDVRSFAKEHEIDPKTDADLFKIAGKRLIEIKNDVEKSDNSLRDELRLGDEERKLRQWLARKLNDRSRSRYTVPQEGEIDQQKRPDLRMENPKTNPVSVEVKWADKWTVLELLEGLEKQLVGQYLRAHNSRYGIYVLAVIGNKGHWEDLNNRQQLTFDKVVEIVRARASELVAELAGVEGIVVIDIDFRAPRTERANISKRAAVPSL